MKRRSFVVAAFAALSAAAVSLPSRSALADNASWWHGLSQIQRNGLIRSRAYQNNGQYTGQTCKEWVRTVVYSASGSVVWVPSNQPYPNEWKWYSGAGVGVRWTSIQNVRPGEIVQMVLSNGTPHTAIVWSVDACGVTFIDCNWYNDKRVYIHWMSFYDFQTIFGTRYSVYYIT